MRQSILIVTMLLAALLAAGQNENPRFSYAATVGTGIAMSAPRSTPFLCQVSGYYAVKQRLLLGIGTGVSAYEKVMIPLFADVKFRLTRLLRFTPYVQCGAGYGFACAKKANGGMYLAPSVGAEFMAGKKLRMQAAVGYESQKLERVKRYEDRFFASEFRERLNHSSLTLRVGFLF